MLKQSEHSSHLVSLSPSFLWSPSPMCGKALVTSRQDAVNYMWASQEKQDENEKRWKHCE